MSSQPTNVNPDEREPQFRCEADRIRWFQEQAAKPQAEIDARLEAEKGEEPSTQELLSIGVLSPSVVDRMIADAERVGFLVEGFLQIESIAIAAGESGIGKSPLFYLLALCVALGIPFLGMPTKQGRVLYLDLENSLADSQQIRDAVLKFLGQKKAPDNFLVKDNATPVVMLDNLLGVVNPVLVIVDSLRAFRPEATATNKDAGTFLNEMRRLGRKHGCSFLFVHHLRKPGKDDVSLDLGDCRVPEWMLEMEGPRAFLNQTDLRIAIAEGDGNQTAIKMKSNRRVFGDSPLVLLERVFDEDGEPIGYQPLTGMGFLSLEHQAAFARLGNEFSFSEAKKALGTSSGGCADRFLRQCVSLGLVEKAGKRYRKRT